MTIDEAAHIPSGVLHWQTGFYASYRVNPPLARMLAVLPMMAFAPNRLDDRFAVQHNPFRRIESYAAEKFLAINSERYSDLIFYARWIGIAWSCLGGWFVFLWCRELYGYRSGLFGLTIWCFEPTILGHAQLCTPDVPCTVAALIAMYAFRMYLRRPVFSTAYVAGFALGLALMTKFTLVILLPVWLISLVAAARPLTHARRLIRFLTRCAHAVVALAVALLFINVCYEFHESGKPLGDIPFISTLFSGRDDPDRARLEMRGAGNRFGDTWLGKIPAPIPEDYLRGMDVQRNDFEYSGRRAHSYLAGKWQDHGWWYYYLYALGVKLPLGELLLWLAGLLLFLFRTRVSASWREETIVYLPGIAILAFVSSQTGFNHHMRYVLPCFPFFIIGASKCANLLDRWRTGPVVVSLLVWMVSGSLRYYPHNLSYFNEAAGGPLNGHAHLLDSNIDWGQDLLFLKKWLDAHPEAKPAQLALFTFLDLKTAGLEGSLPPAGPNALPPEKGGPLPGYYAVSVNALRGMKIWGVPGDSFCYFQHFEPIDRAGYSIYIYHLLPDEVNRVRAAMGLPAAARE